MGAIVVSKSCRRHIIKEEGPNVYKDKEWMMTTTRRTVLEDNEYYFDQQAVYASKKSTQT